MEPFEYPQPELSEQAAIEDLLHERQQAVSTFVDAGLQREAAKLALQTLAEVSQRTSTFATELGLHRVAKGDMTQVELAGMLGVTPGTIGRWVKNARQQATEEPR